MTVNRFGLCDVYPVTIVDYRGHGSEKVANGVKCDFVGSDRRDGLSTMMTLAAAAEVMTMTRVVFVAGGEHISV